MYLFIIVNSYFRSLTWLDLILKMLLSRVTEKPFTWLPWFNFCFCSKTTVVLSFDRTKSAIKILLSKRHLYSKPLTICIICQSKGHQWITLDFVTDYHYIKRKLAINVQIFAVSEVLSGSYCNRNAGSGTETDTAKLIFIW